MELLYANAVVSFIILLVTLVAWNFVNSVWLRPKKLEKSLRDQGFQGNPYRWVYGDVVAMGRMASTALSKPIPNHSHDIIPRIMPFLHHVVKQYGMKSLIWYGRRPRVTVFEPEMIKEIFTKWEVYHKEVPAGRRGQNYGLVMREGDNWAKIRRILNPAFHMNKLKSMLPMMEQSCETMLMEWEDIIAEKGFGEVNVWAHLKNMSANVITRTIFGTSYEEGKRLFKLQQEGIYLSFRLLRSAGNYIPGWRYLPTKISRKQKALKEEIETIVKGLIEKRKAKNCQYSNDLLGVMLESNEKEVEEYGSGMSMMDVIQECQLFHLAGADTTAALLTWTMILLSQHQDWQTKAREEVLQHFGKDKTPEFEDLNHLKIVNMILHETLRFYPPVTSLSRMVHQDVNLKHLTLMQGTELSLPTIYVHRDPEIWGLDANQFNPGRFSEGVSKASKVPNAFLPFGGGPRTCIGQNFALVEARLALAKIVQRFTFHISPSYIHAPRPLVSMEPQFGAPLILHKM